MRLREAWNWTRLLFLTADSRLLEAYHVKGEAERSLRAMGLPDAEVERILTECNTVDDLNGLLPGTTLSDRQDRLGLTDGPTMRDALRPRKERVEREDLVEIAEAEHADRAATEDVARIMAGLAQERDAALHAHAERTGRWDPQWGERPTAGATHYVARDIGGNVEAAVPVSSVEQWSPSQLASREEMLERTVEQHQNEAREELRHEEERER
jgi:hypothetical protein